jgi:hypothetical protein
MYVLFMYNAGDDGAGSEFATCVYQLSDFEGFSESICRIPGVPEILESGSHVVTL